MGFYEVGVYLAIIVVASICVFGMMWLLMKSMQPKRPKGRKRAVLAAAVAGRSSTQIMQESAESGKKNKKEKNKKEKKKKAPKGKEEKLLKLKELPDNRLLPPGENAAASKGKTKNAKGAASAESDEQAPDADQNQDSASQEAGTDAAGQENAADAAGQENAEMTLADLPSMDTLTTEDEAPKEAEIDLMSVFENEDAEDSSTSDLAANLFDVDVQNIEKLGSEVSEFLNGMRSK